MKPKDIEFHKKKYILESKDNNPLELLNHRRLRILDFFNKKIKKIEGNVLDAGAGNGNAGIYLLKNFKDISVSFLDISKYSCDLIKKNSDYFGVKKYIIINSDLYNFKPKIKFDFIISFGTLHHADCLYSFFSKFSELLNDEGYLICEEPTQSNYTTNAKYIEKYNTEEIKFGLKLKNYERDDHFFREAEYITGASFNNLDLIYFGENKNKDKDKSILSIVKDFIKKPYKNLSSNDVEKKVLNKIYIFKKKFHKNTPHKWKKL